MTKKHFIDLADIVRETLIGKFIVQDLEDDAIDALADFCRRANPAFNRERWGDQGAVRGFPMTRTEAQNYARLRSRCLDLGISEEDFESLLRIERTLHRWAERECNGEVETEDEGTGVSASDGPPLAFATNAAYENVGTVKRWRIPNREAGALRRLAAIMARYPKLGAYHQSDPRGCALYVYEKARFTEYATRVDGDDHRYPVTIDGCYSSVGVALCI